jgi:transposase
MAYDEKYRRRALDYWGEGNSKRKTAEVFKVSTSTLQQWKSKLNETGTLAPKKRKQTWRKIEPSMLEKYIEENPDAYLREIAAKFNCAIHAVEKALARLKISRKKNSNLPREK